MSSSSALAFALETRTADGDTRFGLRLGRAWSAIPALSGHLLQTTLLDALRRLLLPLLFPAALLLAEARIRADVAALYAYGLLRTAIALWRACHHACQCFTSVM